MFPVGHSCILDMGWVLETEAGLTPSFLSNHLNILFSINSLAAQGYHFIIGEVMRLPVC